MKTVLYIFIVVAAIFVAFFTGRNTSIKKEEKIVEKVITVRDTVIHRDTVRQILPGRVDTVEITEPVDTLSILADYLLQRHYELDFSNDSIGIFKVYANVYKNAIVEASSEIQPVYKIKEISKTVTQEYIPNIQYYAQIGTSLNFNVQKLSAGLDIKQRFLIGGSVIRIDDNLGYTLDFGIKF